MQIKRYSPSLIKLSRCWRGLALAGWVSLSACSQLPLQQQNSNAAPATKAQQASQALTYQAEFQVSGRISIVYEHNGKPQNLPANFNWQQGQTDLTLQLSNRLGQTEAEIVQTRNGASLRRPGKPLLEAATVDQLLQENLGWSLPSASLAYWLQGFVQRPSGLEKLIAGDQTLQTEGWQLRFASWQGVRPKRLDMQRYTEQTGELRVSIIIDDWNQNE